MIDDGFGDAGAAAVGAGIGAGGVAACQPDPAADGSVAAADDQAETQAADRTEIGEHDAAEVPVVTPVSALESSADTDAVDVAAGAGESGIVIVSDTSAGFVLSAMEVDGSGRLQLGSCNVHGPC